MEFMYEYWTLHQLIPHVRESIHKPKATKLHPIPILRQQLDHIYSNHLPPIFLSSLFSPLNKPHQEQSSHPNTHRQREHTFTMLYPNKSSRSSSISSGTAKVTIITITTVSNSIPLEERREEKGNITPYEKSFAYIIEYKADFPYTALVCSFSLSFSPDPDSQFSCVVSCVPCTGAYIIFRSNTHTYFHGYYQIFSFQTSRPPCSTFSCHPIFPLNHVSL